MGGFKNSSLNLQFKKGLYEIIIDGLVECCILMNNAFVVNSRKIPNHEEKIRTHLVENYLENEEERRKTCLVNQQLRFEVEVQENYNDKNETYEGRVDIKVISTDTLSNRKAYYIIECKRIDGGKNLNQKYITEGLQRFINNKYSSYYGKNIMLGFIVKNINIKKNLECINLLHQESLNVYTKNQISVVKDNILNNYLICESKYNINSKQLLLSHIFYDFSSIIK